MISSPAPVQERVQDLSIEEMGEHLMQSVHGISCEWWASLDYCLLYGASAQRVRIFFTQDGAISKACCYSEAGRLFKGISIYGPVSLTEVELRAFLDERGAHYVTVSMMPHPTLTDLASAGWYHLPARAVLMSVVTLPDAAEAYLASLGQRSRKHLPYYLRRLQKEWADFELVVAQRSEVSKEILQQIVALNRARLSSKGHAQLGWTPDAIQKRWHLAQRCGLVCAIRHNGGIAAGTLSYIHGSGAYFVLIGHDPSHDQLNIGNVCLWLTIRRLIELRISEFNLLWGASFYKKQFGGADHFAYDVIACRRPVAACLLMLLHWGGKLRRLTLRALRFAARIFRRMRARSQPDLSQSD